MFYQFRSREVLELHDPKRAAALLEPNTLRYLEPFIGCDRAADQVAQDMGVSLTTLLYQIKRLLQLGFLEVCQEQPRRGRSIKRYRAVAEIFFVPFDATHFATPADMLIREYEPLYKKFLEHFLEAAMQMVNLKTAKEIGISVSQNEDGKLVVRHGPHPLRPIDINPLEPSAPAILSLWEDQLRLDFTDAKALQLELYELLERYRQKDGGGAYIAHVALAPTRKDSSV